MLSQLEVDQLRSSGEGGLYTLLRRCMLAVLNSGNDSDDARALLENYRDFEVGFLQEDRGLKVSLCLLYTSPSPRDATLSRMPSSA